jgi:hypothetical protein
MCVDPDHPDPFVFCGVKGRRSGDGSRGQRMIAAQQHREFALLQRRFREVSDLATHTRNGPKETCPTLRSALSVLAKRNGDVAAVFNGMTGPLESLAQVGVPNVGAHVHAASRRASQDAD